jgi:peptide chain release factor 1
MALDSALSKLEALEARYEELGQQMMDPGVINDNGLYRQVSKSWSDLGPLITDYRAYRSASKELAESEELLADPEMRDLAQAEVERLRVEQAELEAKLRVHLLPKDPNDDKNVMVEIRPAAGGEEAALFAGDLLRMYTRYAERLGWKVELLDAQETGIGGFTGVTMSILGQGAYSRLKFESGVHRVQRVPATESSGRIHTSTATVAVLPEMEEVEVEVNPNEIQMDIYHASSAGGQNVQKVATAIRITHKPTGIIVTCQDERSQLQNKEKAMRILRAKLYDRAQEEAVATHANARRTQIGSGDRSEKIRTYNFPAGRVTDHRIGVDVFNMGNVLDGGIDTFVEALIAADQAEKLHQETEQ